MGYGPAPQDPGEFKRWVAEQEQLYRWLNAGLSCGMVMALVAIILAIAVRQ
jgi:hypothetical protein